MFQDLFMHMNQTLELLNEKFDFAEDIDQELLFLEKYLYVKEISEDLTSEINDFNIKLNEFENDHGLLELEEKSDNKDFTNKESNIESKEESNIESKEEITIELYEEDFMTLQRGIGYYDLWMYDKATVQLENIIKKYPDFYLARIYSAMTYFKKKDYVNAKEEIFFLFKFTDDAVLNSLAHNLLGMIYGYIQDDNQAIVHFKKAIELKEKWDEPKFNLAIIYYRESLYVEAIKIFEELYSHNDNDWEVLFYLGKSYQKINQFEIADNYYKKIYNITKSPEVIKQIAIYFEKNNCFQKASFWYKKLLTNTPNKIEALIGLGKNIWLDSDKKTGMLLIKKSLCLDSENPEGLLLYAWMLTDQKNNEEVIKVMDKLLIILNKDNKLINTYLVANLARLYYLNTDKKNANNFCSLLQNADNKQYKALGNIVLGLINLDKYKPELAIKNFEIAISIGVEFPKIDFYIGYSYYLLGDVDSAKKLWNKTT